MTNFDSQFFNSFGEKITALRKAKGLTQFTLGELVGVDQTSIASYEAGRRRIPLSRINLLATALNVSIQELLDANAENVKRGPSPKLEQQIQKIANLPRSKQKFASDMLETILQSSD